MVDFAAELRLSKIGQTPEQAEIRRRLMATLPEWEQKLAAAQSKLNMEEQGPHGSGPQVGEAAPLGATLLDLEGNKVLMHQLSTGSNKPMVLNFGSCS